MTHLGDLFWWYNRLKIARFLVQVLIRTNHIPCTTPSKPSLRQKKKKLIQTTFDLTSPPKKKTLLPSPPLPIQSNPINPIQSNPIQSNLAQSTTTTTTPQTNPMAKSARASPPPLDSEKTKRETDTRQAAQNPTTPASARPSSHRQMRRARSGSRSGY